MWLQAFVTRVDVAAPWIWTLTRSSAAAASSLSTTSESLHAHAWCPHVHAGAAERSGCRVELVGTMQGRQYPSVYEP